MSKAGRRTNRAKRQAQSVDADVRQAAERYTPNLIDHAVARSKDGGTVVRTAGKVCLGLFAYNLAQRAGVTFHPPVLRTLPSLRDHIPEPFDLPDHVGNVAWTMAYTGWIRAKAVAGLHAAPSIERARQAVVSLKSQYVATMVGASVLLSTGVEAVSSSLGEGIASYTGGMDFKDIGYGVAAGAILAVSERRELDLQLRASGSALDQKIAELRGQ